MTVSYLGSYSTAQLVPIAGIGLERAIAELEGQISAQADATLAFNPGGLVAGVSLAAGIAAALQAAIQAGVQAPSVSLSFEVALKLKVQLELLLALQRQLAAAGIHALAFEGRADEFGGELEEAMQGLPGVQANDSTYALALVATAPAAVEALKTVFLG